ncbi:TRAPP trafficking subunit Trs65-domain-containing protein [Phycomyces blakesleeanus]
MESNFSSELFFNEADFRVLIPNLHSPGPSPSFETIAKAKQRAFAFYDEPLTVYLLARIPHQVTGTGDEVTEAVRSFYSQLDVHVEASIVDSHSANASQRNTQSKYASSLPSTPSSVPTSPRMTVTHKHEGPRNAASPHLPNEPLPFFTHTYNSQSKDLEMTMAEYEQGHCCIYPLSIPIVYVKNRGVSPQLLINFNVTYRPMAITRQSASDGAEDVSEYDIDMFETVDLLSGLSDGPTFSSSGEKPLQRFVMETSQSRQTNGSFLPTSHSNAHLLTLRRHVRETIPVRSGLMVKMKTTNASVTDKTVMMSVELENPSDTGSVFMVDKIEVQVSHSVVSMAFAEEITFPVTLNTLDQMVFLYNVTLLEDGSVKPPVQPTRMFPSRRINTMPVIPPPSHYQDERLQPQRVSIQVYGAPVIDGVVAASMQSKWNTMLDVTGMRQKREDPNPPDPRFSSLLASNHPVRTQSSLPSSVSVSPGARSVGSPLHQTVVDNKKRIVLNSGSVSQFVTPGRDHRSNSSGPLGNGGARRAPEVEIADGIVVSFTVPSFIQVGKIFPLHIFIVNRSKHTRRFSVMIPSRKRHLPEGFSNATKTALPLLPAEQRPIEPFMEEGEFLRQYFENETHEADVICLENNVRLSPLGPSTSQTVDVRFIAVKEKLHTIDLIQLVDQDTGFVTNLRHVLELFVDPQE